MRCAARIRQNDTVRDEYAPGVGAAPRSNVPTIGLFSVCDGTESVSCTSPFSALPAIAQPSETLVSVKLPVNTAVQRVLALGRSIGRGRTTAARCHEKEQLPHSDLRYSTSASSSAAERWVMSPIVPRVSSRTSRIVFARPSWRYGGVDARPDSDGVSNMHAARG